MSETPKTDAEIARINKEGGYGDDFEMLADFARVLEGELISRQTAYLADRPNGEWIDKWGSCRVCGGEIPHGHMPKCDVFRYERVERAADAMVTALDMAHDFIQSLEVTNHHVMDAINKSSAAYRAEKDKETT